MRTSCEWEAIRHTRGHCGVDQGYSRPLINVTPLFVETPKSVALDPNLSLHYLLTNIVDGFRVGAHGWKVDLLLGYFRKLVVG